MNVASISVHKEQRSVKSSLNMLDKFCPQIAKELFIFSFLASRIGVNLSDLGIAFDHLGIQICELEDYVHQVEPIHFPRTVPQCQPSISTAFHFPTEEELTSREEWYEEYMPPLGRSIKNDDTEMKLVEGSVLYKSSFHPECSTWNKFFRF